MKTGVYIARNTLNEKIYVGSAGRSLEKRWKKHQWELNNNKHRNRHLQAAWNKYGAGAFVFEVVEYCPRARVIEREQHWMDYYRSIGQELYNILPTAGSRLGHKYTPEQVAAASRRARTWIATPEGRAAMEKTWEGSRNPALREQRSNTTRRGWANPKQRHNRLAGLRRVAQSPKMRASRSQTTRIGWADPEIRRKRTEGLRRATQQPEYRQKARERTLKAQQNPIRRQQSVDGPTKEWTGFTAPDGTIYAPVRNLNAFCREHGLTYPQMHHVATGKVKQHKGWTLYQPKEGV